MNNKASAETTRLAVVTYTIRQSRNKERVYKLHEQAMTEGQLALWKTLCDSSVVDEPLRLAMVDAALRVRQAHLNSVLESLGLSDQSRVAINRAMQAHREHIVGVVVGAESISALAATEETK